MLHAIAKHVFREHFFHRLHFCLVPVMKQETQDNKSAGEKYF